MPHTLSQKDRIILQLLASIMKTVFGLLCVFLLCLGSKCLAQNFYVTCLNNGNVMLVSASGAVSTYLPNIPGATGIAMDQQGNLYVASSYDNEIIKVTPAGVQTVFATGLDVPYGMAFDAQGNLFVADNGNSTIAEVSPNGTVSTFANLSNPPANVAFGPDGDLYTEGSPTSIVRITSGGNITTFAQGLNYPIGLAFNASGDLFVSNGGYASSISEISPDGTVSDFVPSGVLPGPYGIMWASDGYLYSPNEEDNTVSKISPDGVITPVVTDPSLLGTPLFMVEAPEPNSLWYLFCSSLIFLFRFRSARLRSQP